MRPERYTVRGSGLKSGSVQQQPRPRCRRRCPCCQRSLCAAGDSSPSHRPGRPNDAIGTSCGLVTTARPRCCERVTCTSAAPATSATAQTPGGPRQRREGAVNPMTQGDTANSRPRRRRDLRSRRCPASPGGFLMALAQRSTSGGSPRPSHRPSAPQIPRRLEASTGPHDGSLRRW